MDALTSGVALGAIPTNPLIHGRRHARQRLACAICSTDREGDTRTDQPGSAIDLGSHWIDVFADPVRAKAGAD